MTRRNFAGTTARAARPMALGLVALLGACGSETRPGPAGGGGTGGTDGGVPAVSFGAFSLRAARPGLVLGGSELELLGRGFPTAASLAAVAADDPHATSGPHAVVRLEGVARGGRDERAVSVETRVPLDTAERLAFELPDDWLEAFGALPAQVESIVRVTFVDPESGARSDEESLPWTFDAAARLTPVFDGVTGGPTYPAARLRVTGEGFLLPHEGATMALLDGTVVDSANGQLRELSGTAVALQPSDERRRDEAWLVIDPAVFGLHPANVRVTMALENRLERTGETIPAEDPPRELEFDILSPIVFDVTPTRVRRGQRTVIDGRGFVPTDSEGGVTTATLLKLEGTFSPRSGGRVELRGETALEVAPAVIDSETLHYVLRVTIDAEGRQQGLGSNPGEFVGTIAPVIYRGGDSVEGDAAEVTLVIEPQLQVVWLHYLPGFLDGLRRFGLRNVETDVRARIRTVLERDYGGFSLRFQEEAPQDFVEYAIVEIGGRDPNGADLFGLDNTEGKDVGNVRLNDVVGGRNADTQSSGMFAFGGVFVEPLLALSPSDEKELPIASPRFDDVFEDFIEERGGRAVQATEWPRGGRSAAIAEAVRVLGSLVGGTITHEVGHTLGMAIADGAVHNPVPGPNQIMDSGDQRPFEERAELDGQGPSVWEPDHREYLETILPGE